MKQKSKVVKKITPNKHLVAAANLIVKEFKTPANLLEFLTNSFNWVEEYSFEREEEGKSINPDTYFTQLLIRRVLRPWLDGGQSVISNIAIGLEGVNYLLEMDEYLNRLSLILKGFATSLSCGPLDNEEMKRYLLAFNTMFEITNNFYEYRAGLKEKNKLSKAA